ncbi:MAG: hypothetical protein RLZZ76_151 [Candidatus Parcubacteria bacterium]|jgi:ribA/ribD-fused uncharacterized protein
MSNTEHLFFGIDFDPNSKEPINFLETRLTDLSPFSAHEVEVDGVVFKTAEHAYQALRVIPSARGEVASARSPMDAWRAGQKCKERGEIVPGFDKDVLMEMILRAKLVQHADIREVLLATGDRELLKVYDTDYYWGTGADGTGENRMGKLWMKLREELQTND